MTRVLAAISSSFPPVFFPYATEIIFDRGAVVNRFARASALTSTSSVFGIEVIELRYQASAVQDREERNEGAALAPDFG